ncbi:alpha/beta hydrolase [Chitinophaga sedimenti]|uniref:alpha/beta fold hydrolase n=1 Tax=Chitinophaga sedimenti TaxID=2033606 RepID=UPI0020061402|nr:alpha/beta hydrolase [Chitinophaga sedimenti]MCK7555531.1 alpha/beta hydrolase [Chitinophaga sedimenti]
MQAQQGQYAQVNGLKLYYETYGDGYPLVLVHGGGSTIGTSFGHIIPELARQYKVIALEMQAHGHTADIDRPLSFEQDADDVAALLQQLHISKANFRASVTAALPACRWASGTRNWSTNW